MSIALTHLGASVRGLAYAMAQYGRVDCDQVLAVAAARRAGALRKVLPASNAAEARDQVIAERGVDRIALMRLPAGERTLAEATIEADVAARLRAGYGGRLDIRV